MLLNKEEILKRILRVLSQIILMKIVDPKVVRIRTVVEKI